MMRPQGWKPQPEWHGLTIAVEMYTTFQISSLFATVPPTDTAKIRHGYQSTSFSGREYKRRVCVEESALPHLSSTLLFHNTQHSRLNTHLTLLQETQSTIPSPSMLVRVLLVAVAMLTVRYMTWYEPEPHCQLLCDLPVSVMLEMLTPTAVFKTVITATQVLCKRLL
jgi:hypothetical protein